MVKATTVTGLTREQLEKLPQTTKEGKQIIYTTPSGVKGGDPFVLEFETFTASSQMISKLKRDPNVEVRSLPPSREIALTLARRAEKRDIKELAQKEAEFEAKRIAEGKIKVEDVILTQKGSKAILTRLLREKAEKELAERLKFPTKEERIREVQRKQRILSTLEKQAKAKVEREIPKRALELFSKEARERLSLGETAQGLLTITEGERKKIIERGVIRADIPTSAEFTKGFEQFLGIGEFTSDFERAVRAGGIFTFGGRVVTGKQLLGEPGKVVDILETKISPVTTKIFRTETLEQEQRRIRAGINELEGKTDRSSVIRRRILKGELAAVSFEIRSRKQFGEQPVESALLFGGGALVTKGVTIAGLVGKPLFKIGTGVLGALFVGGTALETRLAFEEGGIEAGAGVLGERLTEATAFIAGGTFASRFLIQPRKVRVLKAKELEAQFAETLETKGTSAKNLQRLGLTTETKIRVTRFERGVQLRRLKTPKDPTKLAKLLEDPNVRFEFRLNVKTGLPEQVLVREIPTTIVRPKIKPEPFEIKVDGKLGIRIQDVTIGTDLFDVKVGEIKGVVDVKDLGRVIDPRLFKGKDIKGLPKDFTTLQREFVSDVDKLAFNIRTELAGKAKITGKVERVRQIADIFGIDLLPPEVITTFEPVTTRLSFKPILGVIPLFEPSPLLVFPTGLLDIFGELRQEPKEKRKFFFDVDIEGEFKQELIGLQEQIRKSRQRQKPILDQIIEQRITTIQKPILDIFEEQKQLPIVDVIPKLEQEPILDVTPDLRKDLIIDIVEEPKPPKIRIELPRLKRREKIIKGKFEGYNAFAKGRAGKFLKTNLRPLTKESALSSAARVVDNTISGTGKIKKIISKRQPKDKKDFYFRRNRDKFRTFMIRKGKRIQLKDKFIEKRGKRLDTRGEVKQITVARFLAQQRKETKRRRQQVRFF